MIDEVRAFKAQKLAFEAQARRLMALRLISGVDLGAALTASREEAGRIMRRVVRLIERERLKGLRRHWAYDLNRHIALKQALEQLRRVHDCLPAGREHLEAPWKTKRRPKAPS
ncbi:cytoplasmic protein [Neomesorhizobium albiziae]|nr:hypothetical protein GCM10007937_46090 [Mesorhizobium albiziae]